MQQFTSIVSVRSHVTAMFGASSPTPPPPPIIKNVKNEIYTNIKYTIIT